VAVADVAAGAASALPSLDAVVVAVTAAAGGGGGGGAAVAVAPV
jgi:hypothetical protein